MLTIIEKGFIIIAWGLAKKKKYKGRSICINIKRYPRHSLMWKLQSIELYIHSYSGKKSYKLVYEQKTIISVYL